MSVTFNGEVHQLLINGNDYTARIKRNTLKIRRKTNYENKLVVMLRLIDTDATRWTDIQQYITKQRITSEVKYSNE